MMPHRRAQEVTEEEQAESEIVLSTITDENRSDKDIEIDQDFTVTGSVDGNLADETASNGDDGEIGQDDENGQDDGGVHDDEDGQDDDDVQDDDEVQDDGKITDAADDDEEDEEDESEEDEEDEDGGDTKEDDEEGEVDTEINPNVQVEENLSNNEGDEVELNGEETAVNDDDKDGDDANEHDDLNLEVVDEELEGAEKFEDEYGSSLGDDLVEGAATETSMSDDDTVTERTNGFFIPPSNDANENDLTTVSSHIGTSYMSQNWHFLFGAALMMWVFYALSKFFAPNRAGKYRRRDHKRLPTIDDDESSV